MRYILLHKNIPLCIFNMEMEVAEAVFSKRNSTHLPLPLKRILHYPDEFISGETANEWILNEEGCALVDLWLNDRTIPANRENIRKYYSGKYTGITWMLENHSCSMDDCYWTKKLYENITWDSVKLFENPAVDILYLSGEPVTDERKYSGIHATLGGQLEKYWYYEQSGSMKSLYLCKRTDRLSDILNIREVLASDIYRRIGTVSYCDYRYVRNREHEIAGCVCPAFTSEEKELVTAYDLLEEYGMTQQKDVYERIIRYAAAYGLAETDTRRYLDCQTIVDYLVTNRDRHQGNIGFLRNPDTLQLLSPAPVFDSGSSKEKEFELPLGVLGTTVNGLYPTETECLAHVKDIRILDYGKLPSKHHVLAELRKSTSLSEDRIQRLACLYEQKAAFLQSDTAKEMICAAAAGQPPPDPPVCMDKNKF